MGEGLSAIFTGAIGLGLLHGIEPGHGWPIAASYALARPRPYASGALAGAVIGLGHLISSIALVLVFFGAKSYFDLGRTGWLEPAAGVLLVALGVWSIVRGHRHGHAHGDDKHGHDHHHRGLGKLDPNKGLWGLAGAAFALGFAHEEEIQIIGLCAGSNACLELMTAYALAVILAIVALTLLLVAGFRHFEELLAHWTPYLPRLTGMILVGMGAGFIFGVI